MAVAGRTENHLLMSDHPIIDFHIRFVRFSRKVLMILNSNPRLLYTGSLRRHLVWEINHRLQNIVESGSNWLAARQLCRCESRDAIDDRRSLSHKGHTAVLSPTACLSAF
jgi:hypothetical protein